MKTKYLYRLLISFVLTVLLSSSIYYGIVFSNKNYFTSYKKNEELISSNTDYDMLFLGSSRMQNFVNPAIIDSALQTNSFNGGTQGANLWEIRMLFNIYLKNHPSPNTVVLALDDNSLNTARKIALYSRYLPYTSEEIIDTSLSGLGIKTKLYKLFPFLKLNDMDDYEKGAMFRLGLGQKELRGGDFYYKGFVSNTEDTIVTTHELPYRKTKIYPEGVSSLQAIVDSCLTRNINLVFVYMPEYKFMNGRNVENINEILGHYEKVATDNDLIFLRHDRLPMCDEAKFFANVGHLNRKGAEFYSSILAAELQRLQVIVK